MENKKFDVELVIKILRDMGKQLENEKQIPFDGVCEVLDEFCIVFKQLNSFLGIAFSDVKEKVGVIRRNNEIFSGHKGFFSFIKMEIEKGIHIYNAKNNSKQKALKQYEKYCSTSRSLLRMMWLLTFIKVTFQECKSNPKQKLSSTFDKAYDTAFGTKHSWLIRKGAKLAIMASSDRSRLTELIMGKVADEETFQSLNDRFLAVLTPLYDALWNFYKENKLIDLE